MAGKDDRDAGPGPSPVPTRTRCARVADSLCRSVPCSSSSSPYGTHAELAQNLEREQRQHAEVDLRGVEAAPPPREVLVELTACVFNAPRGAGDARPPIHAEPVGIVGSDKDQTEIEATP